MKYFLSNLKILPLYRMLDQSFKAEKISFNYKVPMIKLNIEFQVVSSIFFLIPSLLMIFFFIIVNPVLCYFVTPTVNKTDLTACYLVTSCCKMKRLRFDNIPRFLGNTDSVS